MGPIFKIPKNDTESGLFRSEKGYRQVYAKSLFTLLFLIVVLMVQAQIKVPNMIVPNDSWGLIDANYLYGGCMQVDNHAKMLQTDVQFIKRGMLFVVYDDDDVAPGAQTRIYIFSPKTSGVQAWPYNTPFDIPAALQNKTIGSAGLRNFLFPLNITTNTDPGNKTNVYYDSITNQFYKYDESTDPATYVIITPSAANISVVSVGGLASTNVQSALEELQSKINTNALRFETFVLTDGVVNYPVGFELQSNSQVFYNGVLLDYPTQWTVGASASDLKLLVSTLVYDKIKIQR